MRDLEAKELRYKIEDLIMDYQDKWNITTIVEYPNFYLAEVKKEGPHIRLLIDTNSESK